MSQPTRDPQSEPARDLTRDLTRGGGAPSPLDPPLTPSHSVRRVTVIGAGTMGHGEIMHVHPIIGTG